MREIEREFWKKAEVPLEEYPEVDAESIEFPDDIYVAFAVCQKGCGNSEFIVDDSTQICDLCGMAMFRIVPCRYRLAGPFDPPAAEAEPQGVWVEVDKKGHPKTWPAGPT